VYADGVIFGAWSAAPLASGYTLEVLAPDGARLGGGDYRFDVLEASVAAAADSLAAGSYPGRVRSTRGDDASGWSTRTLVKPATPAPVLSFAEGRLTARWEDGGADRYAVRFTDPGGAPLSEEQAVAGVPWEASVDLADPAPGAYAVTVLAVADGGIPGDWSAPVTLEVLSLPVPPLQAGFEAGVLRLSWPATEGLRYEALVLEGAAAVPDPAAALAAKETADGAADGAAELVPPDGAAFQAGASYTGAVRAIGTDALSPWSTAALGYLGLEPPAGLQVTFDGTAFAAAWEAYAPPPGAEARYDALLYLAGESAGSPGDAEAALASAIGIAETEATLVPAVVVEGETYLVRVRSVAEANASGWTDATRQAIPLPASAAVALAQEGAGFAASWAAVAPPSALAGQPVSYDVRLRADGVEEAVGSVDGVTDTAAVLTRADGAAPESGAVYRAAVRARVPGYLGPWSESEPVVARDRVLDVVSGDRQSVARAGLDIPGGIARFAPLQVRVLDLAGTPVAGAAVAFAAADLPQGMVARLDPSGATAATVSTGADGVATLDRLDGAGVECWFAEGPFTVTATLAEAGVGAAFSLAVAPSPEPVPVDATLAIVDGDGQVAPREGEDEEGGVARFAPLRVRAVDPAGEPVAGVVVSFAAGARPEGMTVLVHPSGGSPAGVLTDEDGVATLEGMPEGASVLAYGADGPLTVVAALPGGAEAVFSLAVEPVPAPESADTLVIVAGDGQSVVRSGVEVPGGFAYFAPLQVRATNAGGRAVPGAAVTFSVGSHPSGMAVQLDGVLSTITVTTDGEGIATLAEMLGYSARCYYAEGPFTILARLADGAKATFSLTVAPTPEPEPVEGTLSIVSGDGQTVPRSGTDVPGGIAKFAALQVKAVDPQGKPLSGVVVDFAKGKAPSGMAVQVHPSGASPASVVTDTNGLATLKAMSGGKGVYAYYADGSFTVVATLPGGAKATFSLAVAPTPEPEPVEGTLSVVSGNGQIVPRSGSDVQGGIAKFAALQVRAVDPQGEPLAGVVVDFAKGTAPTGMAVQVHPSGASPASVVTDADGRATLKAMPDGKGVYAYYADGSFTVVATLPGGARATFDLTAGEPSEQVKTLSIVSGNGQIVPRTGADQPAGVAKFEALQVRAADASGTPISGAVVTFSIGANPNSIDVQLTTGGATSVSVKTGADGLATLNKIPTNKSVYAYSSDGDLKVLATVAETHQVTFSLRVGHKPGDKNFYPD